MNPLSIRPSGDMVLMREEGWKSETSNEGIVLLHVETPPYLTGRVVAVGAGKPRANGRCIPPGYNFTPDDPETHRPNGYAPGDRLTYPRGAGMTLPEGYVLLAAHQIVPALLPDGFLRIENPYRDE